ncbi:MAG TPA: Ig-like domain-containing protein, partial [Acidimicrobiales bacterium]|nr:Ig-like domain-containing protein [Acidimicrobiales bacterium]
MAAAGAAAATAAAITFTGSMPDGNVGQAYSATLQIVGGTPPYARGAPCGAPAGLTESVSGQSVTLSGAPTKVGFESWRACVTDSAGNLGNEVFSAEFFDTTTTSASQFPITPGDHYANGPGACCKLQATVSPGHAESGLPLGTVKFFVDGVFEGSIELGGANTFGPNSTSLQSSDKIDAGKHTLTASYLAGPLPGEPVNPYHPSRVTTTFVVLPAPTTTSLQWSGTLDYGVETPGLGQVDPGTDIELSMDGTVVARQVVPVLTGSGSFADVWPPGTHTFVARYLGDGNDSPSQSPPLTITTHGSSTAPPSTVSRACLCPSATAQLRRVAGSLPQLLAEDDCATTVDAETAKKLYASLGGTLSGLTKSGTSKAAIAKAQTLVKQMGTIAQTIEKEESSASLPLAERNEIFANAAVALTGTFVPNGGDQLEDFAGKLETLAKQFEGKLSSDEQITAFTKQVSDAISLFATRNLSGAAKAGAKKQIGEPGDQIATLARVLAGTATPEEQSAMLSKAVVGLLERTAFSAELSPALFEGTLLEGTTCSAYLAASQLGYSLG